VAEWLDAGSEPKRDARLQYNRITEVRESHRPQTLVHLTLDTGETIRATAGHAFKTTEGWRDAILVKRGGKLLLKGGGEGSESDGSATAPAATAAITDAKTERVATVTEVRTEQTTVRVFNLEVANAHTFFVGDEGAWAHNHGNSKGSPLPQGLYKIFDRNGKTCKFGVAGGPTRAKRAERPQKQLRPGEDFEWVDEIHYPRPDNRERILQAELDAVTDYADQHGGPPPRNQRPKPRR
jgi:hypothetical protein